MDCSFGLSLFCLGGQSLPEMRTRLLTHMTNMEIEQYLRATTSCREGRWHSVGLLLLQIGRSKYDFSAHYSHKDFSVVQLVRIDVKYVLRYDNEICQFSWFE